MTALFNCGTLVDGLSDKPASDMAIVADGANIERIVPQESVSSDNFDQIFDLNDKIVLPGFIDCHVHFKGTASPNGSATIAHSVADQVLSSVDDLQTLLSLGITTVRDVGTESAIPLRDAVQRGELDGPRILTSGGQIGQTVGQESSLASRKKNISGIPDLITGTEECSEVVRLRKRETADLIKVLATPSLRSGDIQQFSERELRAIVEEAERQRMLVASHAHQPAGIRASLKAGVHTIEHGNYMHADGSLFDLMADSGSILVPAVKQLYNARDDSDSDGGWTELIDATLKTIQEANERNLPVAMGSNLTGTATEPHGENLQEIQTYVRGTEMSEMQAIKAATSVAAEAVGTRTLGAITEGRCADIVALEENPLTDISNVETVSRVFKNGTEVRVTEGHSK